MLIFYFQGKPIQQLLPLNPPVQAFDQDKGINASLQYSIISGKCKRIFYVIKLLFASFPILFFHV